jgi:hypothetical protein
VSSGEGPATAVAGTLVRAYRLVPAKVEQIHAGTATANFRVTDELASVRASRRSTDAARRTAYRRHLPLVRTMIQTERPSRGEHVIGADPGCPLPERCT